MAAILFYLFLIAFGIYFVSQMIVFLKDVRFYRQAKWDLSQDSGNKMLFLRVLRESPHFRNHRIGRLRLRIGAGLLFFGVVFWGYFLVLFSLGLMATIMGK